MSNTILSHIDSFGRAQLSLTRMSLADDAAIRACADRGRSLAIGASFTVVADPVDGDRQYRTRFAVSAADGGPLLRSEIDRLSTIVTVEA